MKLMPIIKATAAGVVAIYHAVETAKHCSEGEGTESRQAAGEWKLAVVAMQTAIEELQAKPEPKIQGGDMYFNSTRPVFHGSDDS